MTQEKPVVYHEMVAALVKPGVDIKTSLTPQQAHLWHMATGVSGEAGELLDAFKKHVIYGKPLDRANVIEELGDLEFYMEGLRQELNISRHEIITHNIEKLTERYRGKYSDRAAVERADKAVNANTNRNHVDTGVIKTGPDGKLVHVPVVDGGDAA